MQSTLETARRLGQGQRARLTFADDSEVEVRANQTEYEPGKRLRLELTTDTSGDRQRYRVAAHVDGGEWTSLQAERYDPDGRRWTSLGEPRTVTPLGTFRTVKSSDMEAQADTGTEE